MKLLLAFFLLLVPTVAQAQSSCDKPPLTGTTTIFSSAFPFAVEIPAGITATAFKVTINGTQTPLATTTTTPASNGNQCFLVTITASAAVNTVTTQYTPSGGTEVSSAPFVVSVVSPAPINHPR